MSFWQAYARFWTQAFNLKDRARRLEYWAPIIVHTGFFVIAFIILLLILITTIFNGNGFGPGLNDTSTGDTTEPLYITLLPVIIVLIFVIPNFSLLFRRFQDLNISGWWALVPSILLCICDCFTEISNYKNTDLIVDITYIVVYAVLLVIACLRGTKGPNKYGPDPYTGAYSDRTY